MSSKHVEEYEKEKKLELDTILNKCRSELKNITDNDIIEKIKNQKRINGNIHRWVRLFKYREPYNFEYTHEINLHILDYLEAKFRRFLQTKGFYITTNNIDSDIIFNLDWEPFIKAPEF